MILALTFISIIVLVALYIAHVRPFLESKGYVRPLPVFVQGFRDRLCAHVRSSVTYAVGKLMVWFGAAWELLVQLADFLQIPDLKLHIETLGLGPQFGKVIAVAGIIVMLARLRSLVRA